MTVLAAVIVAGALGALLGGLAVWRWPERHPGAPTLGTRRIRQLVRGHLRLAAVLRRDVDPAAATALVLGAAFLVLVTIGATLAVLVVVASTEALTSRSDDPLAVWAAEHIDDRAADLIGHISRLGDAEVVVLLSIAVVAAEVRRTPTWAVPGFVALTVGGQFALVHLVKEIVDRARPDLLQLTGYAGASFPSGHACAAAATFACFAVLLGRRRSRLVRTLLTALAVGVAAAVAATRVALGVHWSSDVVAGLALGWGWFAFCSVAVGGPRLRFGQPVEVAERVADTTT